MFSNLSKREKLLATVVGGLVPVVLIFMVGMWFSNSYFQKKAQINSLQTQITSQKSKQLEGAQANARRLYYRGLSMPTDFNKAKIDYEGWLSNLARNDIKMTFRNLKPMPAEEKRYTGGRTMETVFVKHPYSLRVDCTLDQLTEFLYEFSQLDLLHRVSNISITPQAAGTTGASKKIRSGKLIVEMKIDAIALVDADEQRDFTKDTHEMAEPLSYYNDKIVTRNIFGPANNIPTMSLSRTRSGTAGSDVSFTITGKDADRGDNLKFELLETPIEGAELSQSSVTSRSAKFQCPALEAGEYGPFKIRITDTGFPPKTSEGEFMLNIREKRVSVPRPKKPEFKHVGETAITGIVQESSGDWKVFVWIKTLGQKYKLKQGETFELDKSDWQVHGITPRTVTFKRDSELLTYEVGDLLSEPADKETLPSSEAKLDSMDTSTEKPTEEKG